MLLALSRFLPRVFHKKVRSSRGEVGQSGVERERGTSTSGATPTGGEETCTKQFSCRIVLLDDTELALDIKVLGLHL